MHLSTAVKKSFLFFLPCLLWCFLYRGFLWGNLYVSEDTFAVYAVVKYFISNLTSGVFAHWNPYMHWGMGHVMQIGEFNPVWILSLILNFILHDFYRSFLWTIVIYYFISAAGVYLLCRMLFDRPLSYLGFILFLFSGTGMTIFTQVTVVLIFTPAVWFFFFLLLFEKSECRLGFWGMVLSLMLIVTTYIPFYFLTSFFVFILLMVLFYPSRVWSFVVRFLAFGRSSQLSVGVGIAGICIACGASILNWLYINEDFVALARPAILSYALSKESGIPISEIMRDPSIFSIMISMLSSPVLRYASEMFDLRNISYDAQRIFYIPILSHILILISLGVKINKRMVLWSLMTFLLFFISIARLSPVYEFLYTHIPFFQLFRNIFLLIPFIITSYILLSLEMFQAFRNESKHRLWVGFIGLFALSVYTVFISSGLNALDVNYLTIMGAALLIVVYMVWKFSKDHHLWLKILILISFLQPVMILWSHSQKFENLKLPATITEGVRIPLSKMKFDYVRPAVLNTSLQPNDIYRLYNWHIIAQKDSPGFFTTQYGYPTQNSLHLFKKIGQDPGFLEYIHHKFVLYDSISDEAVLDQLEKGAVSFIYKPYSRIKDGDKRIKVIRFNANEITLLSNLEKPQFLVYNDSFHPRYRAYINASPVRVYKINFAFKGLMLPQGQSVVTIRFEPLMGGWLDWMFLFAFYGIFLILTISWVVSIRQKVKL